MSDTSKAELLTSTSGMLASAHDLSHTLAVSAELSAEQRLHLAVVERDLDQLRDLLEDDSVDVDYAPEGTTALHLAASFALPEVVALLLEAGATVDLREPAERRGATALTLAAGVRPMPAEFLSLMEGLFSMGRTAEPGLPKVMQEAIAATLTLLLEAGANPDLPDGRGRTPLHHAIAMPQSVRLLLEAGANQNIRDQNGFTPYMLALQHDCEESANALADAMPDTRKRDLSASDNLLDLALDGRYEQIEALVRSGVDINATFRGATALHGAATRLRPDGIRRLAALGADPNIGNKHGATPLHGAAGDKGAEDTIRALLALGANPLAVDSSGLTPIVCARNLRRPENARVLSEAAVPLLSGMKGSSLVVKRRRRMFDLGAAERGVRAFARMYSDESRWELAMVKASIAVTSSFLAEHTGAARHENADRCVVPEQAHQAFVFGLSQMPWALVVVRLGWCGSKGREWLEQAANASSAALGTDAIAFWCRSIVHFRDGVVVERHSWDVLDVDFDALGIPDYDEGAMDAKESELQAKMEAWMKAHDILVPPCEVTSDGYRAELTVRGVKKKEVTRLDIIDLEMYAE